MIVSAIMWQLQRIQKLERSVDWDSGELGRSIFDVIDALFGHIASEERILESSEEWALDGALAHARSECEEHRIHHRQARLACFVLATCDADDRKARLDELRAILREHAKHEMLVVSAMRRTAETRDDSRLAVSEPVQVAPVAPGDASTNCPPAPRSDCA